MKRLGIVLLVCAPLSCQQRDEQGFAPYANEEPPECMLAIVYDLSGSFQELLLGGDARAWNHATEAQSQFFRDARPHDRLLVAQISATPKALLFDDSPQNFRKKFPNPASLKQYLSANSDAGASRVHESIADTVAHVIAAHQMNPRLKSMVLVYSDLLDNFPSSDATKIALIAKLKQYATYNGAIGFYWVESAAVSEWNGILRDCGFKHFRVESDIREKPTIPTFED